MRIDALACVVVKTMMRAEDCSKSASSDGDAGKHVPERRAGQRMQPLLAVAKCLIHKVPKNFPRENT